MATARASAGSSVSRRVRVAAARAAARAPESAAALTRWAAAATRGSATRVSALSTTPRKAALAKREAAALVSAVGKREGVSSARPRARSPISFRPPNPLLTGHALNRSRHVVALHARHGAAGALAAAHRARLVCGGRGGGRVSRCCEWGMRDAWDRGDWLAPIGGRARPHARPDAAGGAGARRRGGGGRARARCARERSRLGPSRAPGWRRDRQGSMAVARAAIARHGRRGRAPIAPPQSRQQLVLNAGARGRAPGRDRRGGRGGAGGVGARHALGPPFKRGGAIGAAAAALPPRLEWRRARYRAPLLPAYSSPFAQRAQLWSPLPTPPFTSPPPPPPSRPPAPPPPCPHARARPAGGGPRRGTGRGRARGSSGRPRACSRAP